MEMVLLDNQCLRRARDARNGRSSLTGRIALQNVNLARWPRDRVNIRGRDMRPESSRRDSMKVAQYEVLGWRSEKPTRPGLSAVVRMPSSLFELRRAGKEKAAP
jgi:hypothetical protein